MRWQVCATMQNHIFDGTPGARREQYVEMIKSLGKVETAAVNWNGRVRGGLGMSVSFNAAVSLGLCLFELCLPGISLSSPIAICATLMFDGPLPGIAANSSLQSVSLNTPLRHLTQCSCRHVRSHSTLPEKHEYRDVLTFSMCPHSFQRPFCCLILFHYPLP